MITLSTPNGPSVEYANSDIASAMMEFARNHMPGYLVQAIDDQEAKYGIRFEATQIGDETTSTPITVH